MLLILKLLELGTESLVGINHTSLILRKHQSPFESPVECVHQVSDYDAGASGDTSLAMYQNIAMYKVFIDKFEGFAEVLEQIVNFNIIRFDELVRDWIVDGFKGVQIDFIFASA